MKKFKPMAFASGPESRLLRKPGERREASRGASPAARQGAREKGRGYSRPQYAGKEGPLAADGRSRPAASSPAALKGGAENRGPGGVKKGAAPLTAGLRGGDWNNNAINAQVSNRNNAEWTNTNRNNNIGGRGGSTLRGGAMGLNKKGAGIL